MSEAVRLLVWDLDETYWKGTVSEGGITEYIQDNHDIVIELAKRGIVSSICSKNDKSQILNILEQYGIIEYFVFPSIAWQPKGARLAGLIDAIQLRAPTVMFIDDNPNNRAEAVAFVPGIQVEDANFISHILSDPRFEGKNDSEFTRLIQYKRLEIRKRDGERATGTNEEFLRGCDIRVCIEYDIVSNIDRAIELINRTNQLNYTKKRLPEDIVDARKILSAEVDAYNCQAGLVRVADKYGDYGFIGFFATRNGRHRIAPGAADNSLWHFCFSCRTLGMFIEQWLYDYLRRPALDVVGDVLTDLSVPRAIDWIRLVPTIDDLDSQKKLAAPEILLGGGCESNAVAVYFGAYTNRLAVYGNYVASGLFTHFDSAVFVTDMCERPAERFAHEAELLGLPIHLTARDLIADRSPGTAFIFNFSRDSCDRKCYRHKVHGWKLWLEPIPPGRIDFVETSEEDLRQHLDDHAPKTIDAAEHEKHVLRVLRVARHMRENYESIIVSEAERIQKARQLIDRIPSGCKFIIAMNHDETRDKNFDIVPDSSMTRYTAIMRELAEGYSYAGVVSFSEVLRSHDEIQGSGNHYSRPVFLRFAQRVVEVLSDLPAKPESVESYTKRSQ